MLKKVYCVFEAKPEEISGFDDFKKRLEDRQLQLIIFETDEFSEQLVEELAKAKDCVLVTDMEFKRKKPDTVAFELGEHSFASEPGAKLPVAGFLNEKNSCSLSYKYLFESFDSLTPDYFIMVYSRFHGLPLEILETERLRVREMTLADIERLYEIYAEPSITEYMEGLCSDKKDELEFAKSYIENMYGFYGYGLWIVVEKASGKIIGRAGLGNREVDGEVYLELGYVIAGESQRKGYATEAGCAILEYARTELDATKVISLIRPGNEASIRTAKKLGFYEVCEVTLKGDNEKYLEFCKEL